jgi:hypothetical protein
MGKGKKALIILGSIVGGFVLLALIGVSAFFGRKTPIGYEAHNLGSPGRKLALVTDGSEYKLELKEALIETLGESCSIEVFGLQDTRKVDVKGYDLVVVAAPVYVKKLQTNAKNFVRRNSGSGNLMLIITSEGTDDIDMGVDTVTMATSSEFTDTPTNPMYGADEAAQMIADKLN